MKEGVVETVSRAVASMQLDSSIKASYLQQQREDNKNLYIQIEHYKKINKTLILGYIFISVLYFIFK